MVCTRFAPSPTGYMHLGNAWVAFLNWWWTRQHQGKVILRIEDIDRQRCREEYISAIAEDLLWLGLDWDEGPDADGPYGPAVQSRRGDFYAEIFDRWKAQGAVYPCYCTRARLRSIASAPHEGEPVSLYDGHCRHLTAEERARSDKTPSWRLRMEEEQTGFSDLFHGWQERTLEPGQDDMVLLRADGMISYQLASASDDGAMGVTHVFRGYDLLPSTFGQLAILERLGYPKPVYGHLPLLVDSEGVRLSKRQAGITLRDFRRAGVSPEAIIGKMLCWAGAEPSARPVSAAAAVRDIDFAGSARLGETHICVDQNF